MPEFPIATPFSESEYESFIECVIDPWEPFRRPKQNHDVVIEHPNGRQIRIDTAHNRVSYRNCQNNHWGLREKPVDNLQTAVNMLMTVAMRINMAEIRLLGLEDHPEPPADSVDSFE